MNQAIPHELDILLASSALTWQDWQRTWGNNPDKFFGYSLFNTHLVEKMPQK